MFIYMHSVIHFYWPIGCWEVNLVRTSGFCCPITNCVPCYSHNFPVPLHLFVSFREGRIIPHGWYGVVVFLQACQGLLLSGLFRLLARCFVALLGFVFLLSCFSLSSCCHVTPWLGHVSLVVPSPSRRDSCVSIYYMCAYC